MTRRMIVLAVVAGLLASFAVAGTTSAAGPDFGPNVLVFDPSMPTSQIQAAVDAVATQQVSNQFGTQRYALLFKPGTYGSAPTRSTSRSATTRASRASAASPGDVVINGSVYVRNQCDGGSCIALNNFWRSLSNLTINVTTPDFGCYSGEFWAVSQAAPMRRVHVNGLATLMDYCTGPSFASGGFIADSAFDGSTVINGSQQQWLVRNSIARRLDQRRLEPGVLGRRRRARPVLPRAGVVRRPVHDARDQPGDARGAVPLRRRRRAIQRLRARRRRHNSAGTTWASGPTPGLSIPINKFFVARPADTADAINKALATGKNLILTPGVYHLDQTIKVTRPDTVVLGLGFPTLVPDNGDRGDDDRRRARASCLGADLRRGPEELAGAAPGRQRPSPLATTRGRPDVAAGRVLPDRRRDARARPRPASS